MVEILHNFVAFSEFMNFTTAGASKFQNFLEHILISWMEKHLNAIVMCIIAFDWSKMFVSKVFCLDNFEVWPRMPQMVDWYSAKDFSKLLSEIFDRKTLSLEFY